MTQATPNHVWTVAEAKARLSEILNLAEEEGPQYIGVKRLFVVMPADTPSDQKTAPKHLGRWLVENTPRGTNLEIPSRREIGREIPFTNEADE